MNAAYLGLDRVLKQLEEPIDRVIQRYPPHNVIKLSDTQYLIELAVAGFCRENITVELQDGELLVTGQQPAPEPQRHYLYRGLASRKFQKQFCIYKGMQVRGCELKDGILAIKLELELAEHKKPKQIRIN
jgi:molecular chaperone IbpA